MNIINSIDNFLYRIYQNQDFNLLKLFFYLSLFFVLGVIFSIFFALLWTNYFVELGREIIIQVLVFSGYFLALIFLFISLKNLILKYVLSRVLLLTDIENGVFFYFDSESSAYKFGTKLRKHQNIKYFYLSFPVDELVQLNRKFKDLIELNFKIKIPFNLSLPAKNYEYISTTSVRIIIPPPKIESVLNLFNQLILQKDFTYNDSPEIVTIVNLTDFLASAIKTGIESYAKNYSCFDLTPSHSEVDFWIKSQIEAFFNRTEMEKKIVDVKKIALTQINRKVYLSTTKEGGDDIEFNQPDKQSNNRWLER